MNKHVRPPGLVLALSSMLAAAVPASISVSAETVPAGAIAQVKIFVTEPMPISHGTALVAYDAGLLDPAVGIHLLATSGDACGAAQVRDGRITLTFSSVSGTLGLNPDYPVLTIAIPVRAGAPAGASSPVTLDALTLVDLLGVSQPLEVKPGSITVGGTTSINDVLPGGGTLAPNEPFLLLGTGFQPGARVAMEGVTTLSVNVVDANMIELASPDPVVLDGARIRLSQRNGRALYYSYLRGIPLGRSSDALIAGTVPVFPANATADALIDPTFPEAGLLAGFAIENQHNHSVAVTLAVYTAGRVPVARKTFSLPPRARIWRSVSEVFPGIFQPGGVLRVTAAEPVRVMGLLADTAAVTVAPVPATPVPAGF